MKAVELKEALHAIPRLLPCAERLRSRYGIPLESGVLITCAAVTAAAGRQYALLAPSGLLVYPSMHMLLVSCKPAPICMAVCEAFEPLISSSRYAVQKYSASSSELADVLEKDAQDSLREAKRLQTEARSEYVSVAKQLGEDAERLMPKAFVLHTAHAREIDRSAEERMTHAKEQAAVAGFIRKPGNLVESLCPSEWLHPEQYAADGAMFNLDVEATTWVRLLGERPSRRLEIAERLVAGMAGAPFRKRGGVSPAWQFASIAVLSPQTVRRLYEDSLVQHSGLRKVLLAFESEADPTLRNMKVDGTAEADLRDFLQALWAGRLTGNPETVWKLSPEAEEVFLECLVDSAVFASSPVGQAETATLVLKLLVLFRICSKADPGASGPVDVQEVRTAISVVHCLSTFAVSERANSVGAPIALADQDKMVLEMAEKLHAKGPLRRRELFRRYHRQRSDMLLPVLERGLASGRILNRDGLLIASSASRWGPPN